MQLIDIVGQCFSGSGVGPLIEVKRTLNQNGYIQCRSAQRPFFAFLN